MKESGEIQEYRELYRIATMGGADSARARGMVEAWFRGSLDRERIDEYERLERELEREQDAREAANGQG